MTVRDRIKRIGGSLGVLLPRDIAEAMNITERNPFADVDWLVVLEASDVPYRDRSPIYKPLGSPVPMDLTVCTRAELEREVAAGNRSLRRVLAESVVLYARGDATAGAAARPAP